MILQGSVQAMKINPAECDYGRRRLLPWLLLLFFGSGFAALIYEIVWLQLLELVIGSSGVSLGVLLGTFMGGMCLGSLLLPRLISQSAHPLQVYALLELGIGLFGILVLFGMPLWPTSMQSFYGHGVFARALMAAVCLIPPTLLMGATLPAVARFVEIDTRRRFLDGIFLWRQYRRMRLPAASWQVSSAADF